MGFKYIKFTDTYKIKVKICLDLCRYLDKTLIFQNGTVSRSWPDADTRSDKSCNEGEPKRIYLFCSNMYCVFLNVSSCRYIILHAENENGFSYGAELILSFARQNLDQHGKVFCNRLKSNCLQIWISPLSSSWTMHPTTVQLKTCHPSLPEAENPLITFLLS